jgi:hypothetical protein
MSNFHLTKKVWWRSLLCQFFGHIGNVQWGDEDKNRKTIHKCSFCYRLSKKSLKTIEKDIEKKKEKI